MVGPLLLSISRLPLPDRSARLRGSGVFEKIQLLSPFDPFQRLRSPFRTGNVVPDGQIIRSDRRDGDWAGAGFNRSKNRIR